MNITQDTGKKRKNLNDQFYTKDGKAKLCVDTLLHKFPETQNLLWIEPSAGRGAFLKALPASIQRIGIDIEPRDPSIQQGDFLSWTPPSQPCVVFGNPPFGRQSSLAKAFIKKAATFADIIAFILPRSFKKPSMNRAFPPKFHLEYTIELEAKSFEVNGEDYSVPCVFQIWKKKDVERIVEKPASEDPIAFTYKKSTEPYHFVIRRVGGTAGKASLHGEFNPQTHYFIALLNSSHLDVVIQQINKHVFPSNTTGPRSLSKGEVTRVLNTILANL
jgi:hypothetical protein